MRDKVKGIQERFSLFDYHLIALNNIAGSNMEYVK